jgi:hypothetical protein
MQRDTDPFIKKCIQHIKENKNIDIFIDAMPKVAEIRQKESAIYQDMNLKGARIEAPEEITVNGKDENGDTLLIWAVYAKNQAAVRALIKANANPNLQGHYKETALTWAANHGSQDIVYDLLVNAKANTEVSNSAGNTALTEGIRFFPANATNVTAVSLLLSHGAVVSNPSRLYEFLNSRDQRQPGMLNALTLLCQQQQKLRENKAEAKQPAKLVEKDFQEAQKYKEKLTALTMLYREKACDEIDKASGRVAPKVLIELMGAYDEPLEDLRVRFFKPAEIDSLLGVSNEEQSLKPIDVDTQLDTSEKVKPTSAVRRSGPGRCCVM